MLSDDEHKNIINAIQYHKNTTTYKGRQKEAYIDGLNTAKALLDHYFLLSKKLPSQEKQTL